MTKPATTFALLRTHDACNSGYRKLAKHLGGVTKYGRDKPIPLLTVLDSNGLDDTLWCLEAALEPWKREAAFIADCAKHARADENSLTEALLASRQYAAWAMVHTYWVTERDWQAKRLRQYLTGKARTLKRAA